MSQQINLLDASLRGQRVPLGMRDMGLVAAAALLLLIAYGGARVHEVRTLEAEAASLKTRFTGESTRYAQEAAALPPRQPSAALLAEVKGQETRLAALEQVQEVLQRGDLGDTRGYSGLMRALARHTVPGVWLTGFEAGPGGRDLALSGRTLEADLVPEYLHRLHGEAAFDGRNFGYLNLGRPQDRAPGGNTQWLEFRLAARAPAPVTTAAVGGAGAAPGGAR